MNNVKIIPRSKARHWKIDSGKIVHDTGRFFSIVGTNLGPMILQPEIGLLGWIYDPARGFLVQQKWEPGNIGGEMLTCTVQATKSNIDRVHGGSEQKYVSLFSNTEGTLQSECGDMFHGKLNRNATISDDVVLAESGFLWVSWENLADCILSDFIVTADAKSALVCSDWSKWFGVKLDESDIPELVSPVYCGVRILDLDELGCDGGIVWISAESNHREVKQWEQPLLDSHDVVRSNLVIHRGDSVSVGIKPISQPGLRRQQWHITDESDSLNGFRLLHDSFQCEEGGRFWKRVNRMSLWECESKSSVEATWVNLGQLQSICMKSECATSELRCATATLLAWLHQNGYCA